MSYQFLAPRLKDTCAPPGLRPRPHVPVYKVLDRAVCEGMADIVIRAHEAGQSWSSRTRYANAKPWDVDPEFRRSKNVPAELEGLGPAFDAMHAQALAARPMFGLLPGEHGLVPVGAQCLVYHEGDYIGEHSDNSAPAEADDGGTEWHVIKPERHLVGLLWLTTQTARGEGRHEFRGGTLRFNSLVHHATAEPLDIAPEAGMMVLFPADAWFRHQVLPVGAGTRIALSRWWQVSRTGEAH